MISFEGDLNMNNIELLPCPFCGRRAELRHDKEGFSFVICSNDGCYVRTNSCLNDNKAITLWNNRMPKKRILEKLEEKAYSEEKMSIYGKYHKQKAKGIYEAIDIIWKGDAE